MLDCKGPCHWSYNHLKLHIMFGAYSLRTEKMTSSMFNVSVCRGSRELADSIEIWECYRIPRPNKVGITSSGSLASFRKYRGSNKVGIFRGSQEGP